MIVKSFEPRLPSRLKKILKILNRIIVVIFILAAILIISNKLFLRYSKNFVIEKINDRVLGNPEVSISSIVDVGKYIGGFVKGQFTDTSEYAVIDMQLSQENILKIASADSSGDKVFVKADFSFEKDGISEKLEGKIRSKGDRALHRESLTQLSYRVNLKGDDRIFGLEKFSIQRPIVRGYSWELLFADILNKQGLITLKSIPVHFSVNGDSRGIYILEEVPSSRTVETQERKAGPIFGLDEDITTHIDVDTTLDVYSEKEWIDQPIYHHAKVILEKQFLVAANKGAFAEEYFDFDEWAKYFALSDLFGTYHGTTPKSVKFYYNPVIGKFQPILFDAHKGAGRFTKFILSDFMLDHKTGNADWIVADSDFYMAFFQNSSFYSSYLRYLYEYSTEDFLSAIKSVYDNTYESLDNYFYSKLSRTDSVFYSGNNLYIFKFSEIENRAELVSNKIKLLEQKADYLEFADVKQQEIESDLYIAENNVNILNNSGFHFRGTELTYNEPTILFLSGDNSLTGLSVDSPLVVSGPVMLVQEGGAITLENVVFEKPRNIQVQNRNWAGAVNILSADANIDNLSIIGNKSEDAVNFVNSEFEIKNIYIDSAFSDAIDFDFSNGTISFANCKNIGNDAIDGSESTVQIDKLVVENVLDKAVSAGENSNLHFESVEIRNAGIGLVSKDGSTLEVSNLEVSNVTLPVSTFIKKPEYSAPRLIVRDISGPVNSFEALISNESIIQLPISFDVNRVSSSDIEDLMYGAVYGVKTIK